MKSNPLIDLLATAVVLAAVLIGGYYYLSWKRDQQNAPVKVVQTQVSKPVRTYKQNAVMDKQSFEFLVKHTE